MTNDGVSASVNRSQRESKQRILALKRFEGANREGFRNVRSEVIIAESLFQFVSILEPKHC